MREHAKVFEGGKPVFKLLDGFGRPGRDVETVDWEIGDYIDYCLMPLGECIDRMAKQLGGGDRDAVSQSQLSKPGNRQISFEICRFLCRRKDKNESINGKGFK